MDLLIVEDLKEYVDSLAFIAEDYFENIYTASNLKDAQLFFKNGIPDVAIVDIRLSMEDEANRDGLDLLKWIKANSFKTKVIMISAYQDFDFAVEALNAGAEYFLKKPVRNSELEELISSLVAPAKG